MPLLLILVVIFTLSCEEREKVKVKVDVKELVGRRGCPFCHDMKRKLLGPSFYEISKRYSEKDRDKIVESILKGSKNKWGDVPMPPQKVSKEEAELIAEWIFNLKRELSEGKK
ncbi:hypothetical protein JCM9492_03100 [Aquifex pyrophilus]